MDLDKKKKLTAIIFTVASSVIVLGVCIALMVSSIIDRGREIDNPTGTVNPSITNTATATPTIPVTGNIPTNSLGTKPPTLHPDHTYSITEAPTPSPTATQTPTAPGFTGDVSIEQISYNTSNNTSRFNINFKTTDAVNVYIIGVNSGSIVESSSDIKDYAENGCLFLSTEESVVKDKVNANDVNKNSFTIVVKNEECDIYIALQKIDDANLYSLPLKKTVTPKAKADLGPVEPNITLNEDGSKLKFDLALSESGAVHAVIAKDSVNGISNLISIINSTDNNGSFMLKDKFYLNGKDTKTFEIALGEITPQELSGCKMYFVVMDDNKVYNEIYGEVTLPSFQ